jgi:hypothetical protein
VDQLGAGLPDRSGALDEVALVSAGLVVGRRMEAAAVWVGEEDLADQGAAALEGA